MLRPHYGPATEDIPVESSSEKKIRYFLAVMFFLQTMLTTSTFMHEVTAEEELRTISALQFVIQADGILANSVQLGIFGLILLLFPLTAFFFCILDKRSKVKFLISGACSVVCAVVIVFGIGRDSISIGAVITLISNVITLFMTSMGVQATSMRRASALRK